MNRGLAGVSSLSLCEAGGEGRGEGAPHFRTREQAQRNKARPMNRRLTGEKVPNVVHSLRSSFLRGKVCPASLTAEARSALRFRSTLPIEFRRSTRGIAFGGCRSPTPLLFSLAPEDSWHSGTKGVCFPLTLTLSLREREPAPRPVEWSITVLFSTDGQALSLSLEGGPGWGGTDLLASRTSTEWR